MSDLQKHYDTKGQRHVFVHFDRLEKAEQDRLSSQASAIDLDEIAHLHQSLVLGDGASGTTVDGSKLEPANYIPLPTSNEEAEQWASAKSIGEEALRAGRVAAFTVAGGQGTRLGFDGPKGTFGVTPVLKKPLFQVFGEKILAASHRYQQAIPWYLMTSVQNHDETVAFFERYEYFGLPKDSVHFFSQGFLPALDENGRILMSEKGAIALSPDGHGGSLRALVRSGAIAQMEKDGTDLISYFQVDNPLVRCIDPSFIGFHLQKDSEMSNKMVRKTNPAEKVGVFCQIDGHSAVVEYSDLPQALTDATLPNGSLRFDAGSIAIHLFNRDFVKRLGSGSEGAKLPFHLAKKKVPHVDVHGVRHDPSAPNAHKFEMFVFDALPFARNAIVIETARSEEFSPVKNAEGSDSPATSLDDQLRQFTRWVRSAGIDIPIDTSGLPPFAFEVSPLFADSAENFVEAWAHLSYQPTLQDGLVLQ